MSTYSCIDDLIMINGKFRISLDFSCDNNDDNHTISFQSEKDNFFNFKQRLNLNWRELRLRKETFKESLFGLFDEMLLEKGFELVRLIDDGGNVRVRDVIIVVKEF